MSNYSLGNEGARQLTEENANVEQLPLLKTNNQDLVYDGDTAFYSEIEAMFDPVPFNTEVLEKRKLIINPTEKSTSEIFTFEKGESGGGVVKLDESFMTANLNMTFDGNDLNDETWLDIMPHPLHTMRKSVDLSADGVSVTNSHTKNSFVSDILNRLYQHGEKNTDLAGCSLGYRNKPGQNSYLSTVITTATSNTVKMNNSPGNERVKAISNKRYIVDDL